MKKRLVKLFRLLIVIVLLPLLYTFLHEASLFFIANAKAYLMSGFMAGLAAYLLLYPALFYRTIDFLEHFEHELAHALVAVIFLRPVGSLIVNPRPKSGESGSKVTTYNPGCLIYLAPYYLPVFVLPLLLVKLVVIPQAYGIVNTLIGITTGFHLASLIKEFRPSIQEDIQNTGLLVSICVTFFLNVVFLVIIVAGVINDYPSAWACVTNSFARITESYQAAIAAVMNVIAAYYP